jgi:hypothetical protein
VSSIGADITLRDRPPRIGWPVIYGFFVSAVVTIVLIFALSHVMDVQATQDRAGILILHDGAWSFAADISLWPLLSALAGLCVAWSVRSHTSQPVSTAGAMGAVAVSAAPMLFVSSPGLLILIVGGTILLLPKFALERVHMRLPRPVLALLVVVAVLVAGSYIAVHPLQVDGAGSAEGMGVSYGILKLSNRGLGDLTIVSVSGATARVGNPWDPPGKRGPAAEQRIPARGSLLLRLTHCSSETLTVRYRLYSKTWTQPVPLMDVSGC